ncbi:MAG: tRNA (adenosine(37)-N6)-threonylcarbamoyltransferase complex transferase subunit TsaD, partial [Desulfobulbaceae bacterium]|nr:tRNA (adenosine(37)-N6)-threonylcarbamoyltransferase complex transferase subunit TsaD [Desulfobulbaceae bacterium]
VLAGGVSANLRLRQVMEQRGKQKGLEVFMPPIEFCTDNAAMVALAGYYRRNDAKTTYDMDVYSRTAVKRR